MSEPELAYMTGTNDDFDLPRWQTQAHYDPLSSSAQAAQAASQAPYLYPQPPPPPPPQSLAGQPSTTAHRLPPIHSSPTGSTRQPRISQLLGEDSHIGGFGSSPYLSSGHNQLSRSTSLGGASARRRHHPVDDLENAYSSDAPVVTNQRQTGHTPGAQSQSFYPPGVVFQQSTGASAHSSSDQPPSNTDAYTDMYFTASPGQAPKRSQTQHDASTSTRSARSPLRGNGPSHTLLDPYSPQQAQYSPTTATYPYSTTGNDSSRTVPSSYSHNRSQSQTKQEEYPVTIPSPYSPPATLTSSSGYPPSYPMDTSSPHPPPPTQNQTHLTPQSYTRQTSVSSPSSPLGYVPSQSPQYYPQDQAMAVDVPSHKRRASGFKRIRDQRDLRPYVNNQPAGRRMDSDGTYLSPLKQLTTNIVDTFHICNPQYRYESTHNPRRVLTKPSKPSHNDGYDNEDYDYILYVNDWLGTEEGHNRYLILDILGQGTFGQVVKCQNMKTHEVVAVKVVKNKPAYFNQSMMEVTILELLNNQCDPHDEHHILRLRDSFIHRNHLCLVFELLSSNLYELIKQNQFQGLSTQLVKVFAAQLLDAMTVLKDARLIHCDLKPENILLKSLQSPQIKVIDFGSACHERQTVYTYIQSRFYRSPEVLLGNPYTAAIDMWSLGCIVVELFLGLPLFPGTSEYNQITRIVDMIGMPPQYMLELGKQTTQFFDSYVDMYGQKKYRLKTIEQYSREHNTQEQPGKQYFKHTTLPEIINHAPMPTFKSPSRQGQEMEKGIEPMESSPTSSDWQPPELNNRASFIDFCQGLLNLNPLERWTPQQARMHPFITGEKWTKPWQPNGHSANHPSTSTSAGTPDPKRPYGGLVSQPKSTRAYPDAATYNHQLAQHQAYTAQAHAASQAANNVFRNPYMQPQNSQQAPATYSSPPDSVNSTYYGPPQQSSHRGLTHQSSHGQLAINTSVPQYPSHPSGGGAHLDPNAPPAAYYPNRARANTINQMDTVPPALARLRHMTQDVIGGRNALTPVLNREDALREWERRQSGKATAAQPYPQLEYLHQQAELATASGLNWGQVNASARYPPPPSKLGQGYQPATIVVDDDRRDAILSNVRSAARGDSSTTSFSPPTNQSYSSGAAPSGARYGSAYPPQPPQAQTQAPTSPFDSVDRRTDIGTLYVPMQPDHYQSYTTSTAQPPQAASRHASQTQGMPPSFYGGGVVTSGQSSNGAPQRNPFTGTEGQVTSKDNRRHSGMDIWPR